jgi:hypothetical protein
VVVLLIASAAATGGIAWWPDFERRLADHLAQQAGVRR